MSLSHYPASTKTVPIVVLGGGGFEMIEERKRRVIELYYKEGRNTREIASTERMSIRDISAIIKEEEAKAQNREDNMKYQIEEIRAAKAYELFDRGKTPMQVATELKIRELIVSRLYNEYMKLKGLWQVSLLCEKIGEDAWAYLDLYKMACRKRLSNESVIRAVVAFNEIPTAEQRCQQVRREAYDLQIEKERFLVDINFLQNEKSKLSAQISNLANGIYQSEENLRRKTEEEKEITRMMFKHWKAILSTIVAAFQTDKTPITIRPRPSLIHRQAIGEVAFEGEVQEAYEGDIAK
jgi:hypothetical protein